MKVKIGNKGQSIYFVFEEDAKKKKLGKKYEEFVKKKWFSGKFGEIVKDSKWIAGLGKKKEYNLELMRRLAAKIIKIAEEEKVERLCFHLPKEKEGECRAVVEAVLLANYTFDRFKKKKPEIVKEVYIANGSEEEIKIGTIMANAQNYARTIAELPPNIITPEGFVKEAKSLAKKYKLKIKVYGKKELEKMKMNGIVSVGKGSKNEPKLVIMEYGKGNETYVFVGKGITFDSGGISLKPSKGMNEMKYDKSGACVVLGIMKGVAELKPKGKIVGIMPVAENIPSATSDKPSEIIEMHNGKKVEIINTDAEGRLILGDALSYAKKYKPKAVIDFATLTGAILIALGKHAIGLFSNNEEIAEKIIEAGEESGERVWKMPLWEEYSEMIKSEIGNIKNIGSESGEAGSITAAAFLKEFVEYPWAHLDIAGVSWNLNKEYFKKGATGVGVRLGLTYLIKNLKE